MSRGSPHSLLGASSSRPPGHPEQLLVANMLLSRINYLCGRAVCATLCGHEAHMRRRTDPPNSRPRLRLPPYLPTGMTSLSGILSSAATTPSRASSCQWLYCSCGRMLRTHQRRRSKPGRSRRSCKLGRPPRFPSSRSLRVVCVPARTTAMIRTGHRFKRCRPLVDGSFSVSSLIFFHPA